MAGFGLPDDALTSESLFLTLPLAGRLRQITGPATGTVLSVPNLSSRCYAALTAHPFHPSLVKIREGRDRSPMDLSPVSLVGLPSLDPGDLQYLCPIIRYGWNNLSQRASGDKKDIRFNDLL